MSIGRKKDKSADKAAQQAAKPMSMYTPLGNMIVGAKNKYLSFNPVGQGAQDIQDSLNTMPKTIMGMAEAASKPFDVQAAYDNPMYNTTYSLFRAPIDRQYEQDQNEMTANLNARGQMGSSYDAAMRRNLMQARDYNLNQASLQGRQASFDAYNQSVSNALSQLAGITNVRQNLMQQLYYPMAMAQGQQQAINPLQAANIAYNTQLQQSRMAQPTVFGKLMDSWGNAAQGAGTAMANIAMACWVAREAYGVSNPKWIRFRKWLLNNAPEPTKVFYLKHGATIAQNIRQNENAKAKMRVIMDSILEAA